MCRKARCAGCPIERLRIRENVEHGTTSGQDYDYKVQIAKWDILIQAHEQRLKRAVALLDTGCETGNCIAHHLVARLGLPVHPVKPYGHGRAGEPMSEVDNPCREVGFL
jgi:hypothetical protein